MEASLCLAGSRIRPVSLSWIRLPRCQFLPPFLRPAITSNGIVTASGFGGFASAAPGSFIEIYGTNLAGTTRGWATDDFTNGNAPTSLDGVTVTVGGKPAYIIYV